MGFADVLLTCSFITFVVVCGFSGFLVILSFCFRDKQGLLLYYPDTPPDSRFFCDSPLDRGMNNSERVHIRTGDGVTLRGFLMWSSGEQQQQQQQQQDQYQDQLGVLRGLESSRSYSSSSSFGLGCNVSASSPLESSCPVKPHFVIIYFHGNAGNVGHRIPIAALLTSRFPCAVLMIDYRGFGHSDSVTPTEEGLKMDAQACLEYVWHNPCFPRKRIFIFGTSLGGAVAINLASQPGNSRRIAGVIVENTFTSISDMSSVLARLVCERFVPRFSFLCFSIFQYYLRPLCLRIGWRSIDAVKNVKAPMLFLSGLRDEIVPSQQMRELYATASKSMSLRRFVEFAEGTHNTMPLLNGYTDVIDGFIREVFESEPEIV
ncbi:putative Bem46-like serine peptidase, putative,Serine peptidase, Clan SC, Family S09X [Trypanosoma theileri]|uniref:Putative Bem46-like serine peptidase, putative,Serine peptidase, Clan SC, Family S09X n=1 Tax=Trypanosoma theileri TaxID=67003 RepID=A0A1X0P675_9TRYP|nr:putative Bem46-like serine peptidase, putative,Serine peptidase, Clan SC, Family S09X [Trypanosoma theileri]ORC92059.1 putative Bem46-like serine peptidase, putative,Serine peptidase, Clan SC, Family S09X [Trypanosoma theileri]